jgi:hypothetical protein
MLVFVFGPYNIEKHKNGNIRIFWERMDALHLFSTSGAPPSAGDRRNFQPFSRESERASCCIYTLHAGAGAPGKAKRAIFSFLLSF